jgi:MFS family permease
MKLLLLKDRNFRLIWIGQMFSILGSRFSELALPWIVLHNTGSPLKAGLVAVCSQIAPLVLAIPAGTWLENQRKKPVALWAELFRALAMFILVLAALMNDLSTWIIALVLLFNGLASLLFRISFHSMLPSIVGRKKLLDAHNYLEGADAISTLIGPVLAGLTFAAIGATGTLGIDALTFLISFITIALIQYHERIVKRPEKTLDTNTKWGQTLSGMKYLVGNNVQRLLTLNHGILNFCTVSVTLLAIIFAQGSLHLDVKETGLLFSAAGLGNILGVYLIGKLKHMHWGLLQSILLFISSSGVLILAFSSNLTWALVGMFVFDGALSMGFVVHGSVRQAITPDHLLARISSTGFLISGLTGIVGSLYAGGIAELLDSRIALGLCGILLMIGGLLTLINRSAHHPIEKVEHIELDN